MEKITACIVCDSKVLIPLFETHDRLYDIEGTFFVKKCPRCSLVCIDPQPEGKILQKHYPSKKYYSYSGGSKKNVFSIVRDYLVKHYYNRTIVSRVFSWLFRDVPAMPIKRGEKVLDVGCGTGNTLALLKELGSDVYGIEIDKKAVDVAKSRGLSNIKHGTYEDIDDYPDSYFNAIRLYHVIEHLPNPKLCIKLIYKKLKPGGEIIMGTPNYKSLASKIFQKYWVNLDTPRHLFVFSPETLSKITKDEGFSKIQIEFCSAGGITGSIIYVIGTVIKKNLNPENYVTFILIIYPLIYPFEWLFDKLTMGDIFVLRAVKN